MINLGSSRPVTTKPEMSLGVVTDQPASIVDAEGFYNGKSLTDRMTGRFYTPDILALDLADRLSDVLEAKAAEGFLGTEVRACDPFCGDGRLIVALLIKATCRASLSGRRWIVTLRDVDWVAAERARAAVAAAAATLNATVAVRVQVGDSFADVRPTQHDVVATNPPWELLKPDVRELAHLPLTSRVDHQEHLRILCDGLNGRFPDARADKAWGGWGTNLARCGWEIALRSCVAGAALGIVLPSTILADQASTTMRRSAFGRSQLVDLAAHPPEARLFERVDQPVVAATFVVVPARGVDASLRLFGADRVVKASLRVKLGEQELKAQGYSLPVAFGAETTSLLKPLSGLPCLSELEGNAPGDLWSGRELDETRIAEKTEAGLQHPFVKGRMVRRHGIEEYPACSVLPNLARGFRSIAFERVVWRDVSRSSQRRRMIGTIIPVGWVAGNSLHVAYFRDGDADRLRALHAVLSSYVLELQVRSRLATSHMSLGIVRGARIPFMSPAVVRRLSAEARAVMNGGDTAHLEVAVAQAYGLDRDCLAAIIDQFPKVAAAERESVLRGSLWRRRFCR